MYSHIEMQNYYKSQWKIIDVFQDIVLKLRRSVLEQTYRLVCDDEISNNRYQRNCAGFVYMNELNSGAVTQLPAVRLCQCKI